MHTDSGQIAAVRDDVTKLNGSVAELTTAMVDILNLVTPILREAVTRERDHNDRSASIRHTGRHRRHRLPPRCGDGAPG